MSIRQNFVIIMIVFYFSSCMSLKKNGSRKEIEVCSYGISLEFDVSGIREDSCHVIWLTGYVGIEQSSSKKKLRKKIGPGNIFCKQINEENLKKYFFDSICIVDKYNLRKVNFSIENNKISYIMNYE